METKQLTVSNQDLATTLLRTHIAMLSKALNVIEDCFESVLVESEKNIKWIRRF